MRQELTAMTQYEWDNKGLLELADLPRTTERQPSRQVSGCDSRRRAGGKADRTRDVTGEIERERNEEQESLWARSRSWRRTGR